MKLILLTTLAALVAADVSHLINHPASSYNLPQNTITGDSKFVSYSTTPAPELALSLNNHQNFGAEIGSFGASGYSTPAPFLDGGLVSSTPAPLFNGVVSSTVAPSFDLNSLGSYSSGVDVSNVGYSTPAPIVDSGLYYSSTPAPQLLNYAPLVSYDSSSINLGPITTSGGSINEAFGLSDYEVRPQVQAHEVNRQVYFYSAPEDEEPIQTRIRVAPATPVKKNIRYIFIKAPSAPTLGQVEIAAPPQAEEKTVVYVLAKKPELEQQIVVKSAPVTEAPKPEVYFIKYRNQKEAEEAISKAQGGHAEGHVSAYNHEGSNDFVGSISRETTRTQPIINYSNEASSAGEGSVISSSGIGSSSGLGLSSLNYAGAFPARLGDARFHFSAPTSSFSSSFVNQPAVQLNRGFSYTTPAPIPYNSGLSYSTSSPLQYNSGLSYTTSSPLQYNSGLSYSTSSPLQYNSGLSYSTAAPIQFQSFSTPTVNIGSGFKSVFSRFNGPVVSSTAEPSSFASSTVAPEISVSSTPAFSSYGLPAKK
ncbi:unnamed protein product [Phaedon cochleariae]|uniref:DUF243 domain-containing protein n=1 Tax=Phaedon cochleariae TaxID=80249 RepID=A0A9P0DUP3_PHACE|nr:unnamed protein product [Phaedon cochleariae]